MIDYIQRFPVSDMEEFSWVCEFRCCNRTDLRWDMPDMLMVAVSLDTGPRTYPLAVADFHADLRRAWEDEAAYAYNMHLIREAQEHGQRLRYAL